MNAIQIGPMALPAAPVLLVALTWAASWAATRLDRGDTGRLVGDALQSAAWIGVLAARLAHVALHASAYAAHPLDIVDVRDGGWSQPAGWVAAVAWMLWRLRAVPAARRVAAWVSAPAAAAWFAAVPFIDGGIDRPLPEVALARMDDAAPLALREVVRGRPAVVNLWASWCGPCRQEMPMLARAQQARRDVQFLFVNQGEAPAVIASYLSGAGLALEGVLLDRASALGPALGAVGLPTTVFVDPAGQVRHVHFGVLGAAALQVRLDELAQAPGHAR